MRCQGKLVRWNDQRGFGFIRIDDKEEECFVHISAYPKGRNRPVIGESLSFCLETQVDGKLRATQVQRLSANNGAGQLIHYFKQMGRLIFNSMLLLVALGLAYLFIQTRTSHQRYQADSQAVNRLSNPAINETRTFRCDGRQHCSQMRSRAEAEYFLKNCPNTKMDGDGDGKPCENRHW